MNPALFSKPILFLIFNRPDLTERVFSQIALLKPDRLYIAADGPRNDKPDDEKLCAQSREILKKVDWDCDLKMLFREKIRDVKKQ